MHEHRNLFGRQPFPTPIASARAFGPEPPRPGEPEKCTNSPDQFLDGTITDPTPYPPGDLVVGYGSNEGSGGNYVVASFEYEFP
ncbi:MAG: hypothetical protein WBF17_23735 [Phycisphaerae bacterium]